MDELRELLLHTAGRAADHLAHVGEMPVFPNPVVLAEIRTRLSTLTDAGADPRAVVDELADVVGPAVVASAGPRYFGFVTGATLPAALGADVLTSAWDQNGYNSLTSPAAAMVEDIAGEWLKDVLHIPRTASFGFVIGAQGANTVSLAAARHHVLAEAGWDVEADGLIGAPRVRVVATGERHATIDRALRFIGLGAGSLEPVATDEQGGIDIADLARVLASVDRGPTIVVLQAGNVNTGAFDDLAAAIPVAKAHGAWVHIDGAFGLWAAASPSLRHLVAGMEGADSWGTDGHKWLNVPYDGGYAFCAHPDAHRASMAYTAAYLVGQGSDQLRSPGDFVMESSRRSRGFAAWAALRSLGRDGVADLVDRCCALARRFAEQLDALDGAEVVHDVVLNQVMVRFTDDATTDRVIDLVQRSGECWMGATTWQGKRLMRISVSGHGTTEADVDRSVAAIATAITAATARP
jgi:glutamate/tyrosine decarboxylase-like PLP-dependent enzyme